MTRIASPVLMIRERDRSTEGTRRAHTAQTAIDSHLVADAAGRCTACGEPEPCSTRRRAYEELFGVGALPQRRPNALLGVLTRPRIFA